MILKVIKRGLNKIFIKHLYIVVLIIGINSAISSCEKNDSQISGQILFKVAPNDSVRFHTGTIDPFFYDISLIETPINNNTFGIQNNFSYPHLFYLGFTSELDSILSRSGYFYLDAKTSSISLEDYGECSIINGQTFLEFKERFAPFFFEESDYNCSTNSLQVYAFLNPEQYEAKLLMYTNRYSDSYVALWSLIELFELNGYKPIYNQILNAFSSDFKTNSLWKKAETKIGRVRTKVGGTYPNLLLQDTTLTNKLLDIKGRNQNYILIDYWFSSCKPCIEMFPKLRALNNRYKEDKFEIISISIDNTSKVPNWKSSIVWIKRFKMCHYYRFENRSLYRLKVCQ